MYIQYDASKFGPASTIQRTSEQARYEKENRHPEDVDDEHGDAERRALVNAADRPKLRTDPRHEGQASVQADPKQQSYGPNGIERVQARLLMLCGDAHETLYSTKMRHFWMRCATQWRRQGRSP
jgi:hypothetical protein